MNRPDGDDGGGGGGGEAHRAFLDRYYHRVRHVYDLTRPFFLRGRDRALASLLAEPWTTLVEVGPGTGRNLRILHRRRPQARLGGIEASHAMLAHARRRCPWAALVAGLAEETPVERVLGGPPDRVLFSYSLSMMIDPAGALARARQALAPGGAVLVVDFGDLAGLPRPLAGALRAWLHRHRVRPLDARLLEVPGAAVRHGAARYHVVARLPPA